MKPKYYYLKHGDEIKEGDEIDSSSKWDDPSKWIKVTTWGDKAPDPTYPAHRRYRRLICTHHPYERDKDDFGNIICQNCGDILNQRFK